MRDAAMLNQNVTLPRTKNWAPKYLGNYSLTDLSQCNKVIATGFWEEARGWAIASAHCIMDGNFKGDYWADEFSSPAVASLWNAWTKYPHLKGEPWFKFAKTVMVRTIKRYVFAEKKLSTLTDSLSLDSDDDTYDPSADVLESRRVSYEPLDGGLSSIEDLYDLNVEFAGFFDALTPSEKRVLPERVNNPSATSVEVAIWAEFRTGNAVRFHEMNYRNKAAEFIAEHPDKKECSGIYWTTSRGKPRGSSQRMKTAIVSRIRYRRSARSPP
jgi:hypothetical protein